jgi:hypothetical protein
VTSARFGWRTAAAAYTSAAVMIALGAPAIPVALGAILAAGWLRWWWAAPA